MSKNFGARQRSSRASLLPDSIPSRSRVGRRRDHAELARHGGFWQALGTLSSIYDTERRLVLGRTSKQWGQCCLCYITLYSVLFGIFVSMMSLYFLHVVDKNKPRHYLDDGLLQMPGINFHPRQSNVSTFMRFIRSDATQLAELRGAVLDYLKPYDPENQVGDRFMDCSNGRSLDDDEKVCSFKTNYLGDCNYAIDFGYEDGMPCFFLRINKVYMWKPENYEPDEVPEEIQEVWQKDVVTITCDGADDVSKEFISELQYYPTQGWPFSYFPYKKQQGYVAPIVAVQFVQTENRVPIFVECRAWAKNLIQDAERGIGVVRFEILND